MRHWNTLAPLACLAVMLGGCASPAPHFYALSGGADPPVSTASTTSSAGTTTALSVAVGPVSVPELVDRPQIVVTKGANQVQLDDFNRWASPLRDDIARVIAADLAQELPGARVWPYAQSAQLNPEMQVLIDVQQFVSTLGDGVVIDVLWSLRSAGGEASQGGRSLVREATAGSDFAALVAAHSRALARVSADIAHAIRARRDPAAASAVGK